MSMNMRIVLTGAGSAGHIYPLIAVADELKKQVPDAQMLYIGTRSQLHEVADAAMEKNDIPVKNILTGKMRRYFSWQYFIDFIRVPMGIIQSLWILLVYMPDAVFSKGGYAAVPVVIAAWIYRIPILTHESDVIPGWANRVGGKFSRFIALTFPEARRYFAKSKTVVTGNPMRQIMTQGDKDRARNKWGIDSSSQVVFVFGGSQGARSINDATVRILSEVTKQAHIIHMSGKGEYDRTREAAGKKGFRGNDGRYTLIPYLEREDMADAYAIADLVVARPGAGTITEIAANAKVSILIPHKSSANGHQRMNAFSIADAGAAIALDEVNIGEHILSEKINQLLVSTQLREQFTTNIKDFYQEDAPKKIVAGILQMLR